MVEGVLSAEDARRATACVVGVSSVVASNGARYATRKERTSELDRMTMKAAPTIGGDRAGAQYRGRLGPAASAVVASGAGYHFMRIESAQIH